MLSLYNGLGGGGGGHLHENAPKFVQVPILVNITVFTSCIGSAWNSSAKNGQGSLLIEPQCLCMAGLCMDHASIPPRAQTHYQINLLPLPHPTLPSSLTYFLSPRTGKCQ